MKNKGLILTLVTLSSLFIVACQSSASDKSSISSYPYNHEEYQGENTSTYREYFSYETDETIRLFENGAFEYIYDGVSIENCALYCDKYFSIIIDDTKVYNDSDWNQYRDYDVSVFLFSYSDEELKLLSDYCVARHFSFMGKTFSFVYEGNTNPPYHYKSYRSETFSFTYYLSKTITSKDDAINLLKLEEYSSFSFIFTLSEKNNCSILKLSGLPISNLLELIQRLNQVDESLLVQPPTYTLYSASEYTIVNVSHYALSESDEIKNVRFIDDINGRNLEETMVFKTYLSLKEYAETMDIMKREDQSKGNSDLLQYVNAMDQTLFDENDVIITRCITTHVTSKCFYYNASYLKDGYLSIVFDYDGLAGGYTSIGYYSSVFAVPKSLGVKQATILI